MTVYRFDRRTRLGVKKSKKTFILILLVCVSAGLLVYILLHKNYGSPIAESKATQVSNNPYKQFSTGYFRFSVPKSWEVADDLGNNVDTFVYRKFKGSAPIGLLTIKVNSGSTRLNIGIVPISVVEGRITDVGTLSDHCSKFLASGLNLDPHPVVIDGVSFLCWTDGTNFIVSAGHRGGNLELPLRRNNGEIANYAITYQNTAFEADRNAIIEVLKTFEAL